MTSMREAWGSTLVSLAEKDERVVVLDGDLATSTKAVLMANAHPERFIEVGIAEQNIVGMAMGLSTLGYHPWLSSFGVFFTQRSLDQIRMLVSQTKSPVKIGGSYAGLLNGSSGKTHQDIEDLAIMRAMPNMTVIAPADANEAAAAVRWASDSPGPVYLRLARDSARDVFPDDVEFAPGRSTTLREGGDVVLVSTGIETARVLDAADLLSTEGTEATVVHVPCLKPLDEDALLERFGDATLVITVEEHSIYGGLGGLVAELVADRKPGVRVVRVGLADSWSESGPNDFLLDKYGMSAEKVATRVAGILAER